MAAKSYFDPVTRKGENVNVVGHHSVSGVRINGGVPEDKTFARKVTVGAVTKYAQFDKSVTVSYVERGKRNGRYRNVTPTDITFLTIESLDGAVLYDTRSDVPCDMDKYNETAKRFGMPQEAPLEIVQEGALS